MGTRGLCGFRYKEKDYLTYNHFDSYPDGLGLNILNEIRAMDFEKLKARVSKIEFVDTAVKPTFEEQLNIPKEFWDLTVSKGIAEDWYCLLRKSQGTIEPYYNGTLKYMIDSASFIKDGLYCEWAYVVNLDTMKFEVWRGFQEKPQSRNRYGVEPKDGYYPALLQREYDLSSLPSGKDFKEYFEVVMNEEEKEAN